MGELEQEDTRHGRSHQKVQGAQVISLVYGKLQIYLNLLKTVSVVQYIDQIISALIVVEKF